MSVRLGLAKVAALVAGTALVGGGAVHVAEKIKAGAPHYVKHAKTPAKVQPRKPAPKPIVKKTIVQCCHTPAPKMAMVPMPPPGLPPADFAPATPTPTPTDSGKREHGGSDGGWGGYWGGFFGPIGGTPYVYGGTTSSGSTSGGHTTTGGPPTTTGGPPTTTGGTKVPAPPMLLLFGAAASSLVMRRRRKANASA
jgi:hypothetical protein